jgi:uncharacterized protein (TIGR02466 family)
MNSEYITMYTHGFLYGYLKDINNEHLKNLAIQNYNNRISSNPNETQSEDIRIPFDSEIKKIIQQMSDAYKKHFGKELKKNPKETSHWSQVHYKGESTQYHHHLPGSDLAGVYYVEVPKDSGDLILKYKKHEFDVSKWYFPPETGKFIIFDAGMEHAVAPNKDAKPRVCISINFQIK